MLVDAKLFRRAKSGNIRAAVAVMSECYPQVHRLAFGLAGREDVARGIVQFVMRRGIRQLPKWSDESEPLRWCRHHTLLTARRAARYKVQPALDTLASTDDGSEYAAFLRAVRSLPMQQREAFILTHGEDWGVRSLAIAMDCSQEAAQVHVREATRVLSELAGAKFAVFCERLARKYQSLAPTSDLILTDVQRNVRRYLWPRMVWSWIRFLLIVAIIVAIGLFVWKIYPMLVY